MTTAASVAGNLTRDPELRFTNSGLAMATFGLAVNRRKRDTGGNWVDDDPQFFDVVVWRELAEHVAESLQKGDRVVVVGQLRQRSWEADDGTKRSKVEIAADEIGPSLRWATAVVTRAERRQGGGSGYSGDEEPF